jgi:hypothetical protein
MTMSLKVFDTQDYHLEIITPTHIGMAQEKAYLWGIDFVYKDRKAFFLNHDQIFRSLDPRQIEMLSALLAEGDVGRIESYYRQYGFLEEPFIDQSKTRAINIPSGNEGKINRLYCTGVGNYAIPGSSLKGALRSVILYHLKKEHGRQADESSLFGTIDHNLMRYLQVSDVEIKGFDSVSIFPTKVFSADDKPDRSYGSWKDKSSGGHNPQFTDKFISFYEAFNPGNYGILHLNIGKNLPSYAGERAQTAPNYDLLRNEDILTLIKKHTRQYLDKEKEYYSSYPNPHLSKIDYRIDQLIQSNEQAGTCLLRVGAGVGFHSITGDWQSSNHLDPSLEDRGQIKAKTRKFTFDHSSSGLSFTPMGFIKLYTEEAWRRSQSTRFEKQMKQKAEQEEKERLQRLQEEERKRLEEEAKKPVSRDFNQLKDGDIVDARVIGMEGVNVKVELYCDNLKDKIQKFRYASGFPNDTILTLKIAFPNRKNRSQFNLTFFKVKG